MSDHEHDPDGGCCSLSPEESQRLLELIERENERRRPFLPEDEDDDFYDANVPPRLWPKENIPLSNGKELAIDSLIAPLALLLETMGARIQHGYQGEPVALRREQQPYLLFYCPDSTLPFKLAQMNAKFGDEHNVHPMAVCAYFDVALEMEWFRHMMRYKLIWCDTLSLIDYTHWMFRMRGDGPGQPPEHPKPRSPQSRSSQPRRGGIPGPRRGRRW